HLAHKRRRHPLRVARRGPVGEGRGGPGQRLQLRAKHRERLAVEPRADVSDVPESRPGTAAHGFAEHQSAKHGPGALRPGPPADEELAALLQLHLAPGLRPPARLVPRVGVLDDEPFPALAAGTLEQRAAVAGAVDALAQPLVGPGVQQRLEPGPPQRERQRAQVLGADAQQVEDDERGGHARRLRVDVARAGEMHPALEAGERRRLAPRVARPDLSVEYRRGIGSAVDWTGTISFSRDVAHITDSLSATA